MNLEFATSAGIITLLSILTTRWETFKISMWRILSFFISVILALITFRFIHIEWVEFGVYIFALVMVCEWIGWQATISVNAVVGTHFLTTLNFSMEAILNEFLLVMIGISIAILVNLFQNNGSTKRKIIENIKYTEKQFQYIMGELAMYMRLENLNHSVWDDIIALEKKLRVFVDEAYLYQNNTFSSHTNYYIDYFEMRTHQCNVLHNLHYQMKKLRCMTDQAGVIADYISYMKAFIKEKNVPIEQIERLENIIEQMKRDPLPESREEFESRAVLYHILQDLMEFLVFKKRFVEDLEEIHLDYYWKKEIGE